MKLYDDLLYLLINLDGVRQDRRFHPEGDALYHSLQVFDHALQAHAAPHLLAAALLHDIGKAIQTPDHAQIGARDLEGVLSPKVTWLVRHHMDLHHRPKRTRHLLRGTHQLRELEQLRAWDIAGRDPYATVMDPEEAIERLLVHMDCLTEGTPLHHHTQEHA
ncbi:MAG: HD domain-containing protein [Myxococcota bacterium]